MTRQFIFPGPLSIVSGGQTGVDRAALDFALKYDIRAGGWCPKGRLAEDGVIPARYPLTETASENPDERTLRNVQESDGTLLVFDRQKDRGTLMTVKFCLEAGRPVYEADVSKRHIPGDIYKWILKEKIMVLNIAGPRESSSPGIYDRTLVLLEGMFLV